uniref:Uncharacterized protein n=1 Tax=Romanomermis culicivorax TaxID=13658 RepID=A0A915I925_ROMCU
MGHIGNDMRANKVGLNFLTFCMLVNKMRSLMLISGLRAFLSKYFLLPLAALPSKGGKSPICCLSLFLDFMLNVQLLGLKLVRDGANNLINGGNFLSTPFVGLPVAGKVAMGKSTCKSEKWTATGPVAQTFMQACTTSIMVAVKGQRPRRRCLQMAGRRKTILGILQNCKNR